MEEHKKRYNLIKEQLDNILKKEEIKYDGNIISAYELRDIINIELNDAYNIFLNCSKEIEKINQKYKRFINKFSRNSIYENLKNIIYRTNLNYETNNQYQLLTFEFIKNGYYKTIYKTISIAKEKQNEDCFLVKNFNSDNAVTKKDLLFFRINLEYIINTLNTMIYYNEKYNISFFSGGIYTDNLEQNVNYGIFNINFNFKGSPNKKEKIKITPLNCELNQTFYKLWLTNECLEDYTMKNLDELLKRIPIKIEELNPLYRQIVDKSLEKNKIKQLKK